MKYTAAVLSALALTPAALAQSSASSAAASASASAGGSTNSTGGDFQAYLQQVLAALTQANLTSLVSVASSIANDTAGQALLSQLAVGNKTVFAPSNEAFAAVPESVSSNTTALVEVLSYHILNNSYTPAGVAVATNHTVARTLLQGGEYALPGNRSAPLVLERESSNATTIRVVQGSNLEAQGPVAAANLQVYIIDQVLELPGNLSTVATAAVPALAGIIPAEILTALENTEGITIFAPNNDAISAAGAVIGTLNSTQIQDVLLNHVINGTVAYSTNIASGQNFTSAGGQPFTFSTNSTGTFVTSGQSTAQIVATDIILNNGVVHLINGVLANTANNATAASDAQASQSSVIATQTEATAPVTQTSDPSNTQGTGGGASGSSTPSGAASPAAPLGLTGTMLGGALGVVAAVMGGAFVLF